jgi:hypothetical protein
MPIPDAKGRRGYETANKLRVTRGGPREILRLRSQTRFAQDDTGCRISYSRLRSSYAARSALAIPKVAALGTELSGYATGAMDDRAPRRWPALGVGDDVGGGGGGFGGAVGERELVAVEIDHHAAALGEAPEEDVVGEDARDFVFD